MIKDNPGFGKAPFSGQPVPMSTLLLRSSWQTVNIGDIAHTPGMLRVLQKHLPGARTILWPCRLDGAEAMLRRHFPELEIVQGSLDRDGKPEGALKEAWDCADFLLHGSGPGLVAERDLEAWRRLTGKPYGAMGITTEAPSPERSGLLNEADFVFTRETHSLDHLARAGVSRPRRDFCPDATFACDILNEAVADQLLGDRGLREGDFFCVIPRLRFTPYHRIHQTPPTPRDHERDAINARYAEADHAKLREAITQIARATGWKVLLCPEMVYQPELYDELILNRLPADVRARAETVRDFWLTDEAAAVYRRSRGVLSFECHSPILATAQLVPVIYLRQPTDTIKGQMWPDLGLADSMMEIDAVSGAEIAARFLEQNAGLSATRHLCREALSQAEERFAAAAACLSRALGRPAPMKGLTDNAS